MPKAKKRPAEELRVEPGPASRKRPEEPCSLDILPDELLLKVFGHLAEIGPIVTPEDEEQVREYKSREMPFRTLDGWLDPHARLRSYPYLGQVCRRWHNLLDSDSAMEMLWNRIVIDFGHELITGVHRPIAWSEDRPTEKQFKEAFSAARLSASRILRFVRKRQAAVRSLTLINSEGFWNEEGNFVSISSKHNFNMVHLGMILGMVRSNLEELAVQRCSDFFTAGHGVFAAIGCLHSLRLLRLEDVQCRLTAESLSELSQLTGLEQVCLNSEDTVPHWTRGIDSLPGAALAALTRLTRLELRGHYQLQRLPSELYGMALEYLDVSYCKHLDLGKLTALTSLRTLALQGHELYEPQGGPAPPLAPSARPLPNLAPLAGHLVALNLSDNLLRCVPSQLSVLTGLRYLDLSANTEMKAPEPLTWMSCLSRLALVDMRGCHDEGKPYWSDAKCTTMKHITALAKHMRRRGGRGRVLTDVNASGAGGAGGNGSGTRPLR